MSHVFFFSYAHANLDPHLREFYETLCEHVAPGTKWAAQHPNISFRDGKNLALMEDWRSELLDAVQGSSVFVAVTSIAYFESRVCGQEYWVFDQRRSLAPNDRKPLPTVLPVIWYPVDGKVPMTHEIQVKTDDMSPDYRKKGLRWLKVSDPRAYERCVLTMAEAILDSWRTHKVPRLDRVPQFANIPHAFAGGQWNEAADSNGWIPGPGVASFIFAAGKSPELAQPLGRYGKSAAEWRPYFPNETRTISEIARAAARKHSLKFREIAVTDTLQTDLDGVQQRQNISVVLADPQTLTLADAAPLSAFDQLTAPNTSLLVLWDDVVRPWMPDTDADVKKFFQRRSQLKPPLYSAPVPTATDLEDTLDITLAKVLAAMTSDGAKQKARGDAPPAQLSNTTGAAAGAGAPAQPTG